MSSSWFNGLLRDDATGAVVVSGLAPTGPALRGTGTGTINGTALVIDRPSALVAGDTMLFLVAVRGTNATTCTPPAGFTQVLAQARGTSGVLFGYTKTADAGDVAAANYTFTISTSSTHAGISLATVGGTVVDVVGSASGASSTTNTCPAVTTTAANTLLVRTAMSAVGTLPLSWVWDAPAVEANEALSVGTGAGGISVATEPQANLGLGVIRSATAAQAVAPATATIAFRLGGGDLFALSASPFNQRLPANAPLAPNNAAIMTDLARMVAQDNMWLNRDSFSCPLYRVNASTPRVSVKLIDASHAIYNPLHNGDHFNELAWRFNAGVPIPAGATADPGTDGHMAILDTDTGEYWEMWVARFGDFAADNPALAGLWSCRYGGWIENHRTNPGYYSDSVSPYSSHLWGSTATSLPIWAGMMSDAEVKAGLIPHALHIVLPDPSSAVVWPAQRGDGIPGKVIPEGTTFRIPATFDVNTLSSPLGATPTTRLRTIARAIQDYGLIVNDKSGPGASMSLRCEDNNVDPAVWGEGWENLLPRLPWASMVVVHPAYRPPA